MLLTFSTWNNGGLRRHNFSQLFATVMQRNFMNFCRSYRGWFSYLLKSGSPWTVPLYESILTLFTSSHILFLEVKMRITNSLKGHWEGLSLIQDSSSLTLSTLVCLSILQSSTLILFRLGFLQFIVMFLVWCIVANAALYIIVTCPVNRVLHMFHCQFLVSVSLGIAWIVHGLVWCGR